jgi:2-dehydro-3-deoxygluconokinase
MGTYFVDDGGTPRGTDVIYDRANSAVTTATPEELPLGVIEDAPAFYTSGITPALSETLAATTETILERAGERGTRRVFDLNYRSKLWSAGEARRVYRALFPYVDVLVAAERDVRSVLGREGDAVPMAHTLSADHGFDTVVLTRGEHGAVAVHGGEAHEHHAIGADTVDAIGTGDAFVGGFLARRLDGGSVPEALAYASATAALKRTITGDVAVVTPEDVEAVIEDDGGGISR